jgi:hypothetical protein
MRCIASVHAEHCKGFKKGFKEYFNAKVPEIIARGRAALERVRFELNHDHALSFCFDAFSSNAFSSEVESGSREENAFFYHLGANWNAKPVPHFC